MTNFLGQKWEKVRGRLINWAESLDHNWLKKVVCCKTRIFVFFLSCHQLGYWSNFSGSRGSRLLLLLLLLMFNTRLKYSSSSRETDPECLGFRESHLSSAKPSSVPLSRLTATTTTSRCTWCYRHTTRQLAARTQPGNQCPTVERTFVYNKCSKHDSRHDTTCCSLSMHHHLITRTRQDNGQTKWKVSNEWNKSVNCTKKHEANDDTLMHTCAVYTGIVHEFTKLSPTRTTKVRVSQCHRHRQNCYKWKEEMIRQNSNYNIIPTCLHQRLSPVCSAKLQPDQLKALNTQF